MRTKFRERRTAVLLEYSKKASRPFSLSAKRFCFLNKRPSLAHFFRLFYALFTIIPLWITVDNSTFTRVRTGVRGQKSCRLRGNRSDFLRRFYLSTPKFKIFKIKK